MRILGIVAIGVVAVACGTVRSRAGLETPLDTVRHAESAPREDVAGPGPRATVDRVDQEGAAEAMDLVLRSGLARDFAVASERGLYSRCEQFRLASEDALASPATDDNRLVAAAGHEGKSADEVARELANPNTPLATLRFKNQIRVWDGDLPDSDQTSYTLLFQPVLPFSIGETEGGGKQVIFFRPAIPLLVDQPVFNATNLDFDGETGLGDIAFDFAYGVTEKSGLLWAVGMYGIAPTASSSELASGHLSLGPEVLLAKFYKWGLIGIFPSHVWDVAGWGDGYVSTTQFQCFLVFLPGDGYQVGTQPITSYNWRSDEWTAPINLTVSKTVILGSTPWKFDIEVNYYFERPDAMGAKWMIGFNVAPVVKNVFAEWFKGS